MSAQQTKLFGMNIPLSPKVLLGILSVCALALAWYNFSDSGDSVTAGRTPTVLKSGPAASSASSSSAVNRSVSARRDAASRGKQGILRVRPIDPTRGEIVDPTLQLALLERLQSVKPLDKGRNLFETAGPTVVAVNVPQQNLPKVKIPVQPIGPPTPPPPPPPPMVNIPLRYYGYAKPSMRGDGNRGLFIANGAEGEKILMATEGDVLEGKFLVVALSANTARVEDIQMKQGQDLQLIPEAISQ